MLHNCDLCPGVQKLGEYIKDLFTEADIDDNYILNFKQWMVKDIFTNLSALQLSPHEFINEVCHQFENQQACNFIVKAQASYLTELKEKNSEKECIILMNFVEN